MALSYNNDSPRTIGCVPAKSSLSYDAALLETVIICFWTAGEWAIITGKSSTAVTRKRTGFWTLWSLAGVYGRCWWHG